MDGDGVHPGFYGGNPDVDPESADTLTLGVVLRSWSDAPLMASMQLSLDWHRIAMEDAIVQVSADNYIPRCFNARANPEFNPDYEACSWFSRDAESGEIVDFMDIYQNLWSYVVSGIDAQFDWRFAAGPGEVGLNLLASWMDYFESQADPRLPKEDAVGVIGGFSLGRSRPEWKWNLNLNFAWSGLTVGGQWRYIDDMRDLFWPDF